MFKSSRNIYSGLFGLTTVWAACRSVHLDQDESNWGSCYSYGGGGWLLSRVLLPARVIAGVWFDCQEAQAVMKI